MLNLVLKNLPFGSDITPLFVGYEKCKPKHTFGPHARDYLLIHFCLSGKGKLCDKYGTHSIKGGELFIIRKGEITTYRADENEPWEYAWIALSGEGCEIFSTERSVYQYPFELGQKFKANVLEENDSPYLYASVIYELIHLLLWKKSEKTDLPSLIKSYIDYNYMYGIGVSHLSETYSFDRSYLYKMFKRSFGVGIKEYITDVRIKNAKIFLSNGASVSRCASMVGYSDEFNFSRAFKKHTGLSPSEWKRKEG